MNLKNNRAPLLSNIKLCASFHRHIWIQTGVTVRKWLNWVLTYMTLTFDLWPWPFACKSHSSLAIFPENFMMIRWWDHIEKGVTAPSSNGIMDYGCIMFSGLTFPSGVTAMLVRCISTGDTRSCLCCNFAQAASWFFQQVYSGLLTVLLMFHPNWRGGSVISPRHTYCSTSVHRADSQASQHIGLESSWLYTVICVSWNPVFAYYNTLIVTMANSHRAPKQWSLTKSETISSFEAWRQNLH